MKHPRKKENVSTPAPPNVAGKSEYAAVIEAARTPLVISTEQAARMLGLRAQTLRAMRTAGRGPAFVRVSANRVAYMEKDLLAFLDARRATSTADARVRLGVA